ncbi:hypothetical protein GCM10027040_00740 [Halomonas shantousis]
MGNHRYIKISWHVAVQGFTLIEALVALLVLSVGLLGIAGMQLKALQSAHAGYQRSIASLAAQDAVELLWSKVDFSKDICPEASIITDGKIWVNTWEKFLPGLNPNPIPNPPASDESCIYTIEVKWDEGRFGEGESTSFKYVAHLPKGGV